MCFKETKKINIVVVSFLNTLPFIHGIKTSPIFNKINLDTGSPAYCTKKFLTNKADIALAPVGGLSQLKDFNIITPFCIASKKNAKSVLLLSNTDKTEIKKIFTDAQSQTSNELIRIIAENFWKHNIKFEKPTKYPPGIINGEGFIAIGDKAFSLHQKYLYSYDLATEWYNFTGLPFVFAVWIAKPHINKSIISEFSNSLAKGVKEKLSSIKNFNLNPKGWQSEYIKKNIHYHLDRECLSGFQEFCKYTENLDYNNFNFIQ